MKVSCCLNSRKYIDTLNKNGINQTHGDKNMSFLQLKNSNAGKLITRVGLKLKSEESAEGTLAPEDWVNSIVKIACIFVIGLIILQCVVNNTGLNNTSAPFYDLMQTVQNQITSGYTLASLMIMVLGAAAIIHYLGFI
jgi:hypothetical protein